jgi:hypothetical protein
MGRGVLMMEGYLQMYEMGMYTSLARQCVRVVRSAVPVKLFSLI